VLTSLQVVDPSLINYELIESLLVHIVTVQQHQGPAGLLKVRQGQVDTADINLYQTTPGGGGLVCSACDKPVSLCSHVLFC
jgi:hypothetical protein